MHKSDVWPRNRLEVLMKTMSSQAKRHLEQSLASDLGITYRSIAVLWCHNLVGLLAKYSLTSSFLYRKPKISWNLFTRNGTLKMIVLSLVV